MKKNTVKKGLMPYLLLIIATLFIVFSTGLFGGKINILSYSEFEKNLKEGKIGYLPQQTMIQKDFPASVWEVVLSGNLNNKRKIPFYTKADRQEAMKNMEKLGITNLKKTCYGELSGGQQQRVLLARALCAMSNVLILDEPVTGLDPTATKEMYELIKELHRELFSM